MSKCDAGAGACLLRKKKKKKSGSHGGVLVVFIYVAPRSFFFWQTKFTSDSLFTPRTNDGALALATSRCNFSVESSKSMSSVGLQLFDLHSAAKQNDIMGLVKLLEEGAHIDKRDPYG